MVEQGIVSRLKDDKIVIDITRHPACSTCRLCRKSESQIMRLEVENSVNARVGDKVVLRLADGALLKCALVVYMFPLAALFAVKCSDLLAERSYNETHNYRNNRSACTRKKRCLEKS